MFEKIYALVAGLFLLVATPLLSYEGGLLALKQPNLIVFWPMFASFTIGLGLFTLGVVSLCWRWRSHTEAQTLPEPQPQKLGMEFQLSERPQFFVELDGTLTPRIQFKLSEGIPVHLL
jgi:hypothetical protein